MLGSTAQCLQAGLLHLAYVFHDFPSSSGSLQEFLGANSQTGKINLPVEVGERWDQIWLSLCAIFLASETQRVDSKGAGMPEEGD